jgi:ribosomal protein L30E
MNIWEIVALNDLIKILKEKEKQFVIVAITLDNTPKELVKIIKKFLKTYSKLYENLTFLYYNANQKDLGRISLLNKDVNEYPYIYHIFDTSNIFVSVNRANQNTIYEAFNAVEEYYKKDLQNYLLDKNNIKNDDNTTDKTDKSSIHINQDLHTVNSQQIKDDEEQAKMNRKALEHQKLLEKITILENKKKDFNIKFLEDIQKRKKEEKNME